MIPSAKEIEKLVLLLVATSPRVDQDAYASLVADIFGLTNEERQEKILSGEMVFKSHVGFALNRLLDKDLITKPAREYKRFVVTEQGMGVLIDQFVNME